MGRMGLFLSLALCLGGCNSAYSQRLVVQSEAAPAVAVREDPADIVAPDDPHLSHQAAPLQRSTCNWQTYTAGLDLTPLEQEARRRRLCLECARHKSNLLGGAYIGATVAYGFAFFGFGSSSFQTKDDGWFGKNSNSGGADKLGHAVTTHVVTSVLADIYRGWGIPQREAALRGAITAWTGMFVMEIGDGVSDDFGFSWPDIAANTAGALFGYFQSSNDRFEELLDFRWEYWPSEDSGTNSNDGEFTTDYEGSAYVLALNLGEVYSRQSNVLDFVDFQVAWHTRHYVDMAAPTERVLSFGFGLNLQAICNRIGLRGLGKVFEYYQPPGISLRWGIDLNE